jgi:hypothetical protein
MSWQRERTLILMNIAVMAVLTVVICAEKVFHRQSALPGWRVWP